MTVATHDDELEQLGDADEDDLDDVDEEEDEEQADGEGVVEDEGGETSLDRLIAQRDARRRRTGDEDDDADFLALASEPETLLRGEPLPERVEPIAAHREFVCRRCFLVKRRSQLADADRMLCRDCV